MCLVPEASCGTRGFELSMHLLITDGGNQQFCLGRARLWTLLDRKFAPAAQREAARAGLGCLRTLPLPSSRTNAVDQLKFKLSSSLQALDQH